MLKIKQFRLKADLEPSVCKKLMKNLSENFELLLLGMKRNYIRKLELNVDNVDEYIWDNLNVGGNALYCGDMVYLAPESLMYVKVGKNLDIAEMGIIGDVKRPEFDTFSRIVKSFIGGGAQWEAESCPDESFQILADESVCVVPNADEIKAAAEFSNINVRNLLQAILNEESIYLENLMDRVDIENIDEILEILQAQGLISTDYNLLCNKTGQQILKVHDRSALDDISKKELKCFICGNPLVEEKLVRAISCSGFGEKMLFQDYWFLVLALESLRSMGFSYEEIMVAADESQGSNLLLNVNDEPVMIHLSNRKISLDDAYLINANIAAYRLKNIIVISTIGTPILMKNHLKANNPGATIHFIDGLDGMSANICNIFLEKEKERILNILTDMGELTLLPVDSLVMKKVVPEGIIEPKNGLDDVLLGEVSKGFDDAPVKIKPDESFSEPVTFKMPMETGLNGVSTEVEKESSEDGGSFFGESTEMLSIGLNRIDNSYVPQPKVVSKEKSKPSDGGSDYYSFKYEDEADAEDEILAGFDDESVVEIKD